MRTFRLRLAALLAPPLLLLASSLAFGQSGTLSSLGLRDSAFVATDSSLARLPSESPSGLTGLGSRSNADSLAPLPQKASGPAAESASRKASLVRRDDIGSLFGAKGAEARLGAEREQKLKASRKSLSGRIGVKPEAYALRPVRPVWSRFRFEGAVTALPSVSQGVNVVDMLPQAGFRVSPLFSLGAGVPFSVGEAEERVGIERRTALKLFSRLHVPNTALFFQAESVQRLDRLGESASAVRGEAEGLVRSNAVQIGGGCDFGKPERRQYSFMALYRLNPVDFSIPTYYGRYNFLLGIEL